MSCSRACVSVWLCIPDSQMPSRSACCRAKFAETHAGHESVVVVISEETSFVGALNSCNVLPATRVPHVVQGVAGPHGYAAGRHHSELAAQTLLHRSQIANELFVIAISLSEALA